MQIIHGLVSNQVLQRLRNQTATVHIEGRCQAQGEVLAMIRSQGKALRGRGARLAGTARRGKFEAVLKGIPVGGPYEVTLLVGDEGVVVENIYVGDVWMLGGQSNMQGIGNLDKAPKPHPQVLARYMDGRWDVAREPIHFLSESPDPVHSPTLLSNAEKRRLHRALVKGVGPGVFFAKEMFRRSQGVPQGLICVAHGGTSMEQWNPSLKSQGGKSLYGSMMKAYQSSGQPVAGMLWYQGESDANEKAAPLYTRRMKQFVAAVRRDFRLPRLPFLMVQIGRYCGASVAGHAWTWNSIQAQQAELEKKVSNLACVSVIDLPLDDCIHVSSEGMARLGVRLARQADRLVYGNRSELPPPQLVSVSPVRNSRLKRICPCAIGFQFKNVVGALKSDGLPSGFAIVDSLHNDHRFIYKTHLSGNRVIVETGLTERQLSHGAMYGHDTNPYANITDARDMALPVFGPIMLGKPFAPSPYVVSWKVSALQEDTRPLGKITRPRPIRKLRLKSKTFTGEFVDMHPLWNGRSGQTYFFTKIRASELMKLNLRMGYDGPIRVWVDEKEVFKDLKGTNPAVPDAAIRPITLKKGVHQITVAMDLNKGLAWGFFLRFERRGVSAQRIRDRDYVVPTVLPL